MSRLRPLGHSTVLLLRNTFLLEPSIQARSILPRLLSLGSSSQSVQYIHLRKQQRNCHRYNYWNVPDRNRRILVGLMMFGACSSKLSPTLCKTRPNPLCFNMSGTSVHIFLSLLLFRKNFSLCLPFSLSLIDHRHKWTRVPFLWKECGQTSLTTRRIFVHQACVSQESRSHQVTSTHANIKSHSKECTVQEESITTRQDCYII